MIANMALHSLWNYYTMDKFEWTAKDVGLSLAVVGVAFAIVQGGLSGVLVKKLGEKGAATLGFLFLVPITFLMGIIPSGWM